jgi:predicted ferric reductase
MGTLILIIVYLVGAVLGYVMLKKVMLMSNEYHTWTNFDRLMGLLCGLFSWIAVFVCLSIYITMHSDRLDKPAKW